VGRTDECDELLQEESVSDLHCVLVMSDGLLLLRDLGSVNGTRVDGKRVRRAVLLPNAELQIGRLRFRVHFLGGSGPVNPDQRSSRS